MSPIEFANYQRELARQRERFLNERKDTMPSSLFDEDKLRVILTDTYLTVTSEERAQMKTDWGKMCPKVNPGGGIDEELEEIDEMFNDIEFKVSESPQVMKKPLQRKSTKDTKNNPLF